VQFAKALHNFETVHAQFGNFLPKPDCNPNSNLNPNPNHNPNPYLTLTGKY